MSLPVLLLPPDQSNYAAPEGHTTVSTILDGGASRFRADQLGGAFLVTVQWTLDLTNFNYLKAFYRTAVNYGSLPFNIDLLLDSGAMQTYVAHFVPDTFGLTSQSGQTFVVGAILEIIPDPSYAVGDAAIIAAGPDAS